MLVSTGTPRNIIVMLTEVEKADLKYAEWCMTQEGMRDEARRVYEVAKRSCVMILSWLETLDRSEPEVRILINDVRRLALLVCAESQPRVKRIAYLDMVDAVATLMAVVMPSVSQLVYEVL